MKKIVPLIVILLCITSNSLLAQQYNFRNFSFDEGFTEAEISAICEDQYGNLWIGTAGSGLFRYDGHTFENFVKADGLSNNFIHALHYDTQNRLWIGTEAGISLFENNQFRTNKVLQKLSKMQVTTLAGDDKNQRIWIGTRQYGLYQLAGNSLSRMSGEQPPSPQINCLHLDANNVLWIGTPRGVARHTDQTTTILNRNDGLYANDVVAISSDQSGAHWFAFKNRGFDQMKNGVFKHFGRYQGLPDQRVDALLTDQSGDLWVGTQKGICKYENGRIKVFNESIGQNKHAISSIYQDQSGNRWFGTKGHGLNKLDSERFVHYTENNEMGKRVYAITEAANGNMIFASSFGGITVSDGTYFNLLRNQLDFTSSEVQTLYYDKDSALWIGTIDDGAFRYDRSEFKNYSQLNGLKSNAVNGFAADTLGNIWMANADSGLAVLPLATEAQDALQYITTNDGLSSNRISCITADAFGHLWVGTRDAGLNKILITGSLKTNPLNILSYGTDEDIGSNSINCILTDRRNNVYVGTEGGGISIIRGSDVININQADGLNTSNVYSLILDRSGNLWAGTDRGVTKLSFNKDLTVKNITNYGSNDGFKGVEAYQNASYLDSNGNLWFGTVNGVIQYRPNADRNNSFIPDIQLTGIKLFFDDLEATPYGDSTAQNFPIPDALTLPYDQHTVSFAFNGTYLRNPEAVRYRWKLEGNSAGWSPPLKQREATFSNLSPGTYTFNVMAGDAYGQWHDKTASFNFTISRPPWEQWWVLPSIVLAFLLIASLIIYFRFRRIKIKNQIEKERILMEKNIIELEQEASRLQMNPHFIFNSLNSIQGFISTNDRVQAKRYLVKFAKLMRLILENAREEFIPLENEVNILDNYLELEKLSSNHGFDFSIDIMEPVEVETMEIPPMMIQPFVENAILHGVRRKENGGHINLSFQIAEDLLICEITDNGIGRKASSQHNQQTRKNHKSTGIHVTTKRLEQHQLQSGLALGVEIIDLEEDGVAKGTKVVIKMPFEG